MLASSQKKKKLGCWHNCVGLLVPVLDHQNSWTCTLHATLRIKYLTNCWTFTKGWYANPKEYILIFHLISQVIL